MDKHSHIPIGKCPKFILRSFLFTPMNSTNIKDNIIKSQRGKNNVAHDGFFYNL